MALVAQMKSRERRRGFEERLAARCAARSEFRLHVPRELAVVGFDDIAVAGNPAYGLTTIHQPISEMIDAAADRMLGFIEGSASRPLEIRLESELICRGSTRELPTSPRTATTKSGSAP